MEVMGNSSQGGNGRLIRQPEQTVITQQNIMQDQMSPWKTTGVILRNIGMTQNIPKSQIYANTKESYSKDYKRPQE